MHEKVAQEVRLQLPFLLPDTNSLPKIYYFLVKFPVYEQLLRDFDTDTPHSDIFPLGQPYKSLYAIHALKEYIVCQTQKVSSPRSINEDNLLISNREV